jgi:hypothetical protein
MTRGTATGVKRKVLMAGGALAMAATTSMMGAQPANATLCSPRVYSIVWDGWQGTLNLCSQNGDGSWLQQGTTRHKVTYREGRQQTGYDHRIRFNVDFAGTPANASDDQPFDGYFLTRQPAQRRGLAGITYWQGIPFGFYAARVR